VRGRNVRGILRQCTSTASGFRNSDILGQVSLAHGSYGLPVWDPSRPPVFRVPLIYIFVYKVIQPTPVLLGYREEIHFSIAHIDNKGQNLIINRHDLEIPSDL